jgi:hypothetical protein
MGGAISAPPAGSAPHDCPGAIDRTAVPSADDGGHGDERDLPPQLRDLSSKAQFLSEALRCALQVTLSTAPSDSTPDQVLADAFARLGYLPDEAKQAGLKILAKAEDNA